MSQPKFTPGPWRYASRNVNEIMTTFHGVQIGRSYIDVATENEKADAHLVAAAPELYEALDEVFAASCPEVPGSAGSPLEKARAALAKARGEQS